MKKLITSTLCLLTAASTFAAPVNPMDYYTADNVDQVTADYLWNNMTKDVDGKDCYKRAQIWTMGMTYPNGDQVKSKKIFIHYTQKFNRMLDMIKKERDKWGSSDIENQYGVEVLNAEEKKLYKKNITWDYHVAPMIEVNGRDVVLDRYLKLPYDMPMPYVATKDYKLELVARRATPTEWLEALSYRGEMLWNIKKKVIEASVSKIERKLSKTKSKSSVKKYTKKLRELKSEYIALEMDQKDTIDIKCQPITSMAELDANHENGWCYYSVVPMYYFNEIDLRNLSYGITSYNHVIPLPIEMNTPENNEKGRQFIQNSFNIEELKVSLGEINNSETRKKYSKLYKRLKDAEKAQKKKLKSQKKQEKKRIEAEEKRKKEKLKAQRKLEEKRIEAEEKRKKEELKAQRKLEEKRIEAEEKQKKEELETQRKLEKKTEVQEKMKTIKGTRLANKVFGQSN